MRKILLSFVLIFATLAASFASDAPVISLSDAIESAMKSNTDMEVARLTLQQNMRTYNNTASYIPDLSLTGSATAMGSLIHMDDSMISAGFDVGISMSLGTSLIGSTAVNNAMRTVSELNYAISASNLEQSVTGSYWALVSSKKSMDSARLNLISAERTRDSVIESYNVGLATSLDLSNAELSVLNYEYALKQLEDAYALSKETFRTLTGIEGDFDVEDFPETVYLNLPSAEELFDRYGNNTNSIRLLNANIQSAEASLTNTKVTTAYPSVSLSLNYNVGGDGYYPETSLLHNGFDDTATATVRFSIPISSYIPGSSANNTIRNAEDTVAMRKVQLNAGRSSLLSSIRSTLLTLNQSRQNIEIATERLSIAQNSYSLAEESYNAGLLSLRSLQEQADSLAAAELSLITAESSYVQSLYTLASTLNMDYESLIELYASTGD